MVSGIPMEYLLEDGDELPKDPLLQVVGEPAPDAFGRSGHDASHSFSAARRSIRAALLSLLRGGATLPDARLVAPTGMRSRIPSR